MLPGYFLVELAEHPVQQVGATSQEIVQDDIPAAREVPVRQITFCARDC